MIKVIVVDDEKVIREGIGRFVKETEGFELLQTCEMESRLTMPSGKKSRIW